MECVPEKSTKVLENVIIILIPFIVIRVEMKSFPETDINITKKLRERERERVRECIVRDGAVCIK